MAGLQAPQSPIPKMVQTNSQPNICLHRLRELWFSRTVLGVTESPRRDLLDGFLTKPQKVINILPQGEEQPCFKCNLKVTVWEDRSAATGWKGSRPVWAFPDDRRAGGKVLRVFLTVPVGIRRRSSTNSRRSYGSRLDARSRRSVPSRRGAVAEFKTCHRCPWKEIDSWHCEASLVVATT